MNKITERIKDYGLYNVICTSICFILIALLAPLYIDGEIIYTYMFLIGYGVVAAVLAMYAEKQGANRIMVTTFSLLIAIGVLVQNVIAPINPDVSDLDKWVFKQFIIAGFAICFIIFYMIARHVVLKRAKEHSVWFALVAALGTLLFCCVLPEVNGARNWLYIGSLSLQITEFIKFFGIIFMGEMVLTEYSDWTKFLWLTGFMGICALLLILRISEMGTLIVLALVYAVLIFNYFKSGVIKAVVGFGITAFVVIFAFGYSSIDTVTCQWDCINGCKEIATDEKGEKLKDSKGNYIYTDEIRVISGLECPSCKADGVDTRSYYEIPTYRCSKCFYKKYDKTDSDYVGFKCPVCSDHPILGSPYGNAASKIYQRFAVFLSYEKCENEDFAQQINLGLKAAKLGGWFGAEKGQYADIILPHNDSVVVAVGNRMGMIWVLFILLCYYALFLSIRHSRSPVKVSAILALFIQTIITYLGNYNLFALTGIGVPFISSGGTIYAVSLAFAFVIFTRDERYMKGKIKSIKEVAPNE